MAASKLNMIGRRATHAVPIILLATFLVFGLTYLIPGDIALKLAGENATADRVEEIRRIYHLDQPFLVQYGSWLGNALHGDLGRSLMSQQDVLASILRTLPRTLLIVLMALTLAFLIGTPLGIYAATRRGTWIDNALTATASLGVAMPSFWVAMVLVSIFSMNLGWFPATGMVSVFDDPAGALWRSTLPAIALAGTSTAEVTRQMRSAFMDILGLPHIRTLHAKGLSPAAIVWRHGLKNVAVTQLTLVGLMFNRLLGATVVLEAVFAIPGLGDLIVNAAVNKDFPILQGVVLTTVIVVVLTSLAVDLLCAAIDPRVSRA